MNHVISLSQIFLLFSLVFAFSFAKAQSCSQTSPCVISICNDLQNIILNNNAVYYILTNNIVIPLIFSFLTFVTHFTFIKKIKRKGLLQCAKLYACGKQNLLQLFWRQFGWTKLFHQQPQHWPHWFTGKDILYRNRTIFCDIRRNSEELVLPQLCCQVFRELVFIW